MLRHLNYMFLGIRSFIVLTLMIFIPMVLIVVGVSYLFWILDTVSGSSVIPWPPFMPWLSIFPAAAFFVIAWHIGREIEEGA